MNKKVLLRSVSVALALGFAGAAQAQTTVQAHEGVCTNRSGSPHATTVLFFGRSIRNVIATTNERQRVGGVEVSQDTDLTFDIWKSNAEAPGECLGSVDVHIDGGTNERVEVAIEDLLPTPWKGQGIVVRTGQLDARSKFDIYVDLLHGWGHAKRRQTIWNNFTGMPNNSRLMSTMRFGAGQHLAIYFSGQEDGQANAKIQVFRNDGTFVGVADQKIGEGSVVVTDSTRSLDYRDFFGNPVPASDLPKDGEGYLKVLGVAASEIEASCVVVYTRARVDSGAPQAWHNGLLLDATITFARRNANNDPLPVGE